MVLISVHYCLVIELASLSGWYCPSLTPGCRGGGGGVLSQEWEPTAVRPSSKCGCCELTLLKKGDCHFIESSHKGAVIVLSYIFSD